MSWTIRSTERPPHVSAWLADLRSTHEIVDIALAGLSHDNVSAMLSRAGASAVDHIVELSGGNPFFVTQLDQIDTSSGDHAADVVPESVQLLIDRRASKLSERAQRVLRLAA